MYATFFSLTVFIFWWLLGTATLSVFPSKLRVVQKLLISPSVGIAVTILPVFLISRAGVPVKDFAGIVLGTLLILSLGTIIIKRPILPKRKIIHFSLILMGGLLLAAWPIFQYGFDWTSYNNDDMANYCLGAQRFLNHGYFELPNLNDLFAGRDYSQAYWFMHAGAGMRSGSELLLAFFWGATKLNAHQLFMPIILALHLSLIAATGALVVSPKLPKKTPLLAMAFLSISPLTTLGLLYQLIGQVGGLALLCTAIVLFYRQVHSHLWWQQITNNVVAALVFSSLFVWYPEALPFLGIGWFIFLGLKIRQSVTNAKWIIIPALIIGVLSLFFTGDYLLTALKIMLAQASSGMQYARFEEILFPYFLVPTGLPILFGLMPLANGAKYFVVNLAIAFAFGLLIWLVSRIIKQIKEIYPATILSALMLVLGVVLFFRNSDFGLFKLAMMIQPFMVAVVAIDFSKKQVLVNKKSWFLLGMVIFIALLSQKQYVVWSTSQYGGPNELPFASSKKSNRQFSTMINSFSDKKNTRLMLDTSNVIQAKFQALYSQGIITYFPSRDFLKSIISFSDFNVIPPNVWKHSGSNPVRFIKQYHQLWNAQYKQEHLQIGNIQNTWVKLPENSQVSQTSHFIASSAKETIFNISSKDRYDKNNFYTLIERPRNYLLFINSKLGSHYYYAPVRSKIAFFQLEHDPMLKGQLVAGLGRHILFRIIGADPHPRMLVELSDTVLKQSGSRLPAPSVWGSSQALIPFVGRGAGRVFSDPISPAVIDSKQYIDLDMGKEGQLQYAKQGGLVSLYGQQIAVDSRRLTTYGRNISLVSEEEYQSRTPPSKLEHFPQDLADKNLEYSGIYEDGWISERSFFILSPKSNSTFLVIKGMIPELANHSFSTSLQVLLNGKVLATRRLSVGDFEFKIPISDTQERQRIDLTFTNNQRLRGTDARITSGKINFIGFVG